MPGSFGDSFRKLRIRAKASGLRDIKEEALSDEELPCLSKITREEHVMKTCHTALSCGLKTPHILPHKDLSLRTNPEGGNTEIVTTDENTVNKLVNSHDDNSDMTADYTECVTVARMKIPECDDTHKAATETDVNEREEAVTMTINGRHGIIPESPSNPEEHVIQTQHSSEDSVTKKPDNANEFDTKIPESSDKPVTKTPGSFEGATTKFVDNVQGTTDGTVTAAICPASTGGDKLESAPDTISDIGFTDSSSEERLLKQNISSINAEPGKKYSYDKNGDSTNIRHCYESKDNDGKLLEAPGSQDESSTRSIDQEALEAGFILPSGELVLDSCNVTACRKMPRSEHKQRGPSNSVSMNTNDVISAGPGGPGTKHSEKVVFDRWVAQPILQRCSQGGQRQLPSYPGTPRPDRNRSAFSPARNRSSLAERHLEGPVYSKARTRFSLPAGSRFKIQRERGKNGECNSLR